MAYRQTFFTRVPPKCNEATARETLRDATRSAHARVEALLCLASPTLTRHEYSTTLSRFCAVYAVLERQIDDHTGSLDHVGLDWQARRKLPLLKRDLEALGSGLPVIAQPSCSRNIPLLDTFARAMGCMYVLEGATLGGKVISLNLQRALQIGRHNGAAFFNSYGPAVHANWQEFCVALERSLQGASHRQQAVDAAIATFNLFDDRGDGGEKSYVS